MSSSEENQNLLTPEKPLLAPAAMQDNFIESATSNTEEKTDLGEINIISISLFQIDTAAGIKKEIKISGDLTDLNGYLKNLLSEVDSQEHKRSYKVQRDTSEFAVAMNEFSFVNELVPSKASGLAEKLLQEEIRVDQEYSQLNTHKNKSGIVNKGSFLQFLYETSAKKCYLGVKIEHQMFFDEIDFKKKSGLPESSKVYKACRVVFSGTDLEEISVYDKNTMPSKYWWSGFLELIVLRDDALNTERAAKAIVRVLDAKVKKNHPEEYTQLRNAAVLALKQEKQINYNDLVDDLLKHSVFEDPAFNAKIPDLIQALKKCPTSEKDGFDLQFQGSPGAVPYKRRRIDLGRDIFISFPEEIGDLNGLIWTTNNEDGEKLVVIKSESGYDYFKKPQ